MQDVELDETYHEDKGLLREEKEEKAARTEFWKKVGIKLHSGFWVLMTCLVWIYSRFWQTVTTDPRIDRVALGIGLACLGICVAVVVYLAFIVPYQDRNSAVKRSLQLERHFATHVLTAALSALTMMITFTVALWPVYHLISFLIVGTTSLGALFSFNLVPV